MAKPSFTWRIFARRMWMFGLALVIGLMVGWGASKLGASAGSTYDVGRLGQNPYESAQLARTYARLLPEEPGVLSAVAAKAHMSEAEVRQRLSMLALPGTAVIVTRLSAQSPKAALSGVRALAHALQKGSDRAGSQTAAVLTPLSSPGVTTSQFPTKTALVLGALMALGICFALVVTLERRNPRVDELSDLADLLPLPVSQVSWRVVGAAGEIEAGEAQDGQLRQGADDPLLALLFVGGRARRAPISITRMTPQPLASLTRWATDLADRVEERRYGALLVMRGTPAAEIERARRMSLARGRPVVGALLVGRRRFAMRSAQP